MSHSSLNGLQHRLRAAEDATSATITAAQRAADEAVAARARRDTAIESQRLRRVGADDRLDQMTQFVKADAAKEAEKGVKTDDDSLLAMLATLQDKARDLQQRRDRRLPPPEVKPPPKPRPVAAPQAIAQPVALDDRRAQDVAQARVPEPAQPQDDLLRQREADLSADLLRAAADESKEKRRKLLSSDAAT